MLRNNQKQQHKKTRKQQTFHCNENRTLNNVAKPGKTVQSEKFLILKKKKKAAENTLIIG